jgi:hypothetical protein
MQTGVGPVRLQVPRDRAESARFWASVMTDLRNRGIRDILIACYDGLKGFEDAINAAFPATVVQTAHVLEARSAAGSIPRPVRRRPGRCGNQGGAYGCADAEDERDYGAVGTDLSARTARPDVDLEPATCSTLCVSSKASTTPTATHRSLNGSPLRPAQVADDVADQMVSIGW